MSKNIFMIQNGVQSGKIENLFVICCNVLNFIEEFNGQHYTDNTTITMTCVAELPKMVPDNRQTFVHLIGKLLSSTVASTSYKTKFEGIFM